MAQKTYKQIQDEANRMFGKGASREKFEWRRQQQAAAGLEKESKKRGGVAGTYDRNKALVQAAAPVLAGLLVPGAGAGIAGAVTGGLARGLDRPGQGGIGLDLGQAARGAVTGYGLGQLGGMAGTKLGIGQTAAAPAPAPAPAPSAAARPLPEGVTEVGRLASASPAESRALVGQMTAQAPVKPGAGITTLPPRTAGTITPPATAAMPAPTPVPAPAPTAGGMALDTVANANTVASPREPGVMSRLLAGARENAPLIQATATPLAAVIGGRMEQDIEERKLRLQEEQIQREQEARDRLAQLLMPMFQQQAQRMTPRRG
jgi:hypothetical protein